MFINIPTRFCYFSVEAITITAAGRRDETATTIHKTSVATTQVSTKSDNVSLLRCLRMALYSRVSKI
jgi:hypothetical protein